MLPVRAIALIREYSKPITHPYWRSGTSHAMIIKESPPMRMINDQIKRELVYRYDNECSGWGKFSFDIIERTFPGIYDYMGNDYIQTYGEELLELLAYESIKGKHLNFYYYTRQFLVHTKKFKLIDYEVKGGKRGKTYLEWIFV
jgi:hypothetical protein